MSGEYAKVVVGQEIDDTAHDALLAQSLQQQQDIEAQSYNPVVGQEVDDTRYFRRPVHMYGSYGQPSVMVLHDPGEPCAFWGCMFSWIPIVGFVTFCMNADAPPYTRRAYWSNIACMIATFVLLINLLYWPFWYFDNDDK